MDHRIQKIRNLLSEKKLDAILVSTVSNIFYLTGFSGFSNEEREAYLLITKNNQYIFTDGRYKEAVEQNVQHFGLQLISPEASFVYLLKHICEKEKLKNIGFEENDITFWEYKRMSDIGDKGLPAGRHGDYSFIPISLNIRIYKDPEEITRIQKACGLGDKTFEHILQQIKRGVSEKELQIAIELFMKQQGAEISFRPIVAFGANASMPHHESLEQRTLENNECVLIDMGAKVHGYCSDMTRTVFFGKPSDEEKRVYETVLTSQQKAIDYINQQLKAKQQITAMDVDKVSREYILSQGYPSIPHSLGHGTGIDVHEPPSLNPKSEATLRKGMVFSLEPGIYIPGSMGVRIEDLVVLEETGLKILTLSPKQLICL